MNKNEFIKQFFGDYTPTELMLLGILLFHHALYPARIIPK
jgi:hypothetical protein